MEAHRWGVIYTPREGKRVASASCGEKQVCRRPGTGCVGMT